MEKGVSGLEKHNQTEDQAKFIEVWEDLVSIKDLFLSILITASSTMIGYFLAHDQEPLPLFFWVDRSIARFRYQLRIVQTETNHQYRG